MPKNTTSKIPDGARIIRTYKDFLDEVEAFDRGERGFIIVLGSPGTGKSYAARNKIKDSQIINGKGTPYGLYCDLYDHINKRIVLDDADRIFKGKNQSDGVPLIKCLTQTDDKKHLSWKSRTSEIRSGELPSEFSTTSKLMIIANSWISSDPDIEAIEDRAIVCYFRPTPKEVHRYASAFVKDRIVYDEIGRQIDNFMNLTLRIYTKASDLRKTALRTGNDKEWRKYIEDQMMPFPVRVALMLMKESFASDNARAKEFSRMTHVSERTFYRIKNELEGVA